MNTKLLLTSLFLLLTTGGYGQGKHATITLTEPGTLESQLESAGFESVESLTVAGTFGGADLNFIRERGPLVSGMTYLDLTNAVLTNDEVPYNARHYDYTTNCNLFYLAPDNKREETARTDGTDFSWYRNDLTYAFFGMKNLKVVKMPKTLTAIGAFAFSLCENLEEVVIPESVDSIGPWAFYECGKIRQVNAPNVTKYGPWCFRETGITSFAFPQGTKTIPYQAMGSCPALKSVTIPSSVTVIEGCAFIGCYELRSVTLNEGLKVIRECAFGDDWRLPAVDIPSTVEEIEEYAFGGQEWVDQITPEGGIIYLGKVAYKQVLGEAQTVTIKEGTTGLTDGLLADLGIISVKLPSSLKSIGTNCFVGSTFTSVKLPEGLEKIGVDAFMSCNRLTSITIPENVRLIGGDAFRYCTALTEVNYNARDAQTFERYLNYVDEALDWEMSLEESFDKILGEPYKGFFLMENEGIPYIFSSETLKKVTLGSNVKRIPFGLFCGCTELESIDLGGHVESIGGMAFSTCPKLKSIDLTGVREIGPQAFAYHQMSEIRIPASVERIGNQAFMPNTYYNDYPQKVYAYAAEPATVILQKGYDVLDGNVIFDYLSSLYTSPATLHVLKGTKSVYAATGSWANSFSSIEEDEELSGVQTIAAEPNADSRWHTLQGTAVKHRPTRPGLYINSGRKVVVR